MPDIHLTEDLNRSFTAMSEEELQLELEEFSGQESGVFSTLKELNTEIDRSAVFGVADVQGILNNNLKPLMENVVIGSYNLLHLSEHLRPRVLQEVGDVETGDQLSEMDRMRMQLADLKRHLVRAEEEKLKVCTELQQKLKMSLKREESLKRTIKKTKVENKTKLQQLHHILDKAKEEAREMEMKLRTHIISLKIKLVDEHAILAKELKKSMKNEMELERTKNHWRQLMRQN